jgi:hypothetical protein
MTLTSLVAPSIIKIIKNDRSITAGKNFYN